MSSPEPPLIVSLTVVLGLPVTIILPLVTADASISLSASSPVWKLPTIVNVDEPRLVNVALPNVIFEAVSLVLSKDITSIPYKCSNSGAETSSATASVKLSVSVPAPPLTVSTPPEVWKSLKSSTVITSLPAPASM